MASKDKLNNYMGSIRHSLAHLLAMAVLDINAEQRGLHADKRGQDIKKYGKSQRKSASSPRESAVLLGIGPTIENGFYYDFDFKTAELTRNKKRGTDAEQKITESDLPEIEKRIRELIKQNLQFKKENTDFTEAKKIFINQLYKLELIKELMSGSRTSQKLKSVSIYQSGNFIDLCKGPHVKNTKEINPDAFKLTKIAGAYWKGSEKNPMLTRIYGVAFETKKELDDYLKRLEEAEKRDHRKLGKELNLFHIDETVGLGLPLWHPKGALLWRIIEEFWYKKHLENGYELVRTPHIGSRILWETSGHWGFFNKSMYPPLEIGQTLEERQQNKKTEISEEYLLKPMNCPLQIQIYKNNPKSYRELPLRWAECGTVYRFEKKGELSGLTRVRGFTQDDAHIICRKNQVKDELKRVIDFILFIYESFGFSMDNINIYLSLRDPKDKKKYAGNDAGWKFTQDILRKVAREKKLKFKEEIGEAAFYGPKLDFKIKDVIGREWQCSTLQFDFNLPERFDMNYVNEKGEQERPYMLHRALFGSYERFIGLLIEHYAGAFPLWLSPVQIRIINVGLNHLDYAKKILEELKSNGIRVELIDENSVGKRIREAEMQKIPYILVVGDKEIQNETVNVRHRGQPASAKATAGKEGEIKINEFIEKIKREIENKAI
ncbi:MAG: threonine--tRNA ligase [bacterium]|nr:threonine--tRNA ligase [bacterium]